MIFNYQFHINPTYYYLLIWKLIFNQSCQFQPPYNQLTFEAVDRFGADDDLQYVDVTPDTGEVFIKRALSLVERNTLMVCHNFILHFSCIEDFKGFSNLVAKCYSWIFSFMTCEKYMQILLNLNAKKYAKK